jgi:hypothetical protein
MRRRAFITLLGGAAAWPLAVRAQQSTRVPKIGVLWPGVTFPPPPRMEAFRGALRQLGYIEGQNVAIELRYAEGGLQQLPNLAAELVRLKVDVIAAFGDLAPKVAQQATGTIPIVAIGDDIFGAGHGPFAARRKYNWINDPFPGAERKATRVAAGDCAANVACSCLLGPDDGQIAGGDVGECSPRP